ncbi:MAG TPA: NAD(+) synthase [Candidatus Limnocylindrales bacterium]|jgi:NAD+ synthase|nr:NAD(+) synthase [Candidatus Limnocylindrales bacterium]
MNTPIQSVISKLPLHELFSETLLRSQQRFSRGLLEIDCPREVDRICTSMRQLIFRDFRKKGVVVGLSGGIDSSTVAALAARAMGPDRVIGLLMPEKDSSAETLALSHLMAEHLGIKSKHEDISTMLEAAGCYRRRDDAIRLVVPEYGPGWKSKLVLPNVVDGESFRLFAIVTQSPNGEQITRTLTLEASLGIVAATNFKQRTRKMLEYFHADRLNYAVAGTPNRLEYELGFFVKLGDGAADFKPIAHLYKSQVYQLATYLGVPREILNRPPTTDTYSLPQTQQEFYFCLPYELMDLMLYAQSHGYTPFEIAAEVGLRPDQIERVFRDIDAKRRIANYLNARPSLMEYVN